MQLALALANRTSYMKRTFFLIVFLISVFASQAEDGYRLWMRYDLVSNPQLLSAYRNTISSIHFPGNSPSLTVAKDELLLGLEGLLGRKMSVQNNVSNAQLVIGTPESSTLIAGLGITPQLAKAGGEGFVILSGKKDQKSIIAIAANTDVGVLYGVFHFLRLLQTQQNIQNLSITSAPKIKYRLLNHWDNLNRSVERGYAGISIWNWHTLPGYIESIRWIIVWANSIRNGRRCQHWKRY